ncbi:ferrous iron transporter B [Demequina lutea]|uniref:Ferrous iron transport protein B n=1 Tax=Demequina lutea TaxID=431489 RepID=A0A7Y9Z6V6_9MICO|nr:ferrous iron transporter B [Demequina lutea]NYI39897.1 ferrous iron transport protein B [Demequina lutea]
MSAQGDCHSGPTRGARATAAAGTLTTATLATVPRTASVLLVGNPNVGKSTLFNALTRARQRVVNAPGTTVDLTQGVWSTERDDLTLVDLPGTYSLIARSPDEQVAADAVRDTSHDLAVVVLDATALSRSLYLLGQVARAGRPVVTALTMFDLAQAREVAPDAGALSQALGVPVIEVNGRTGKGLQELASAVTEALENPSHIKGVAPHVAADDLPDNLTEAQQLFDWVETITDAAATSADPRTTVSDRLDRVLLNPWVGPAAFLAVVWGVFQLTTVVASPLIDAVARTFSGPVAGWVTSALGAVNSPSWFESFIVGGVLAGVGTVLSFVPLMAIMFAAVSALESTGYLARVAVVADKAMRALGLDGRAMLPLIVGFGCNVPALSATAVLPHARQRLLTGLLVPLTSCTARLAVYLLLAHTFFPGSAGTVVFGMYVASVALVIGGGLIARHTVMRDLKPEPLIIALPDYQLPHLKTLGMGVWTRIASFIRKAGSVIVVAVMVLWALQAIPVRGGHEIASVPVNDSVYGAVAQGVAPALAPMGLNDWRISASLVAGIAAKEVTIASLAQSYALDSAKDASLGQQLRATVERTSGGAAGAAALALMVFVLAYLPCMATLAEQRRLYGLRWTAAAASAQLVSAYGLAILVFQVGRLL